MSDVFISYKRENLAAVSRLVSALRAEGVGVWWDQDIPPTAAWESTIERALAAAKLIIVAWSPGAVASDNVKAEARWARTRGRLLQVFVEACDPPLFFGERQGVDLRHWSGAASDPAFRSVLLAARGALAHPAALAATPLDPDGKQAPPAAKWLRKPLLIAAAIALTAASALAAWRLWPQPRWTVESSRSFISTMALEGEPAFSPDGKALAYTYGADPGSRKIYVRNLAGGDAVKITGDAYTDVSPTWSPDGARIAYVAVKPGEPCRIMVATVPAGEARQVGRCAEGESSSVSWQPGTSFLYYADRRGKAGSFIFRLDLETGALTQLLTKTLGKVVSLRHVQCSPDGKSLLWIWAETASTDALLVRDLASGQDKLLARIVGGGSAAWSEDSRAVLTSRGSGIGSEITAYPMDGGKPYRLYTTTNNVSHLAAGKGGRLALETDISRQNLAHARTTPNSQPDIIEAVNGKTWAPTFAPDGTLAFLSNRSGTNAIWVMKPGAAPSVLYDAGLVPLFRLEYSPDGTKLALVIARENGLTLKVLAADGSPVSSFDMVTLGYGHPTWTPDGKGVTAFDRPRRQSLRIEVDNPAQRTPVAASPPWSALAVRGDGIFAVKFGAGGLWRLGGTSRLVSRKYPLEFASPITFRGEEVLVPDFNAAGGARVLAQPVAGGRDRMLAYLPGAEAQDRFFESKMAVNPKTSDIVYVATVQGDTNIDLLTLAKH